MEEGDTIGRVIIMELNEQDTNAFNDFISFLQVHPEIKQLEFSEEPILSIPNLEILLNQRKIFYKQQEISFTKTEYEIFLYLLQNTNRVLTYSQMYERVWQEPDYGEGRKLVSHHTQAIRRKLKLDKSSNIYLRCIREIGYSLEIE